MLSSTDTIVFQGDSITDAGRNREDISPNSIAALGRSYAYIAAARLLSEHPHGAMKVYNRGVGGDRINELVARWETDTLALKPDVVSILVGINDAAGASSGERKWNQPIEDFEGMFRAIIDLTIGELPDVRLVICEPFLTFKPDDMEHDLGPALMERRSTLRRIAADVGDVSLLFRISSTRPVSTHLAVTGLPTVSTPPRLVTS